MFRSYSTISKECGRCHVRRHPSISSVSIAKYRRALNSLVVLTHYGANLSIKDCPRAGVAQWKSEGLIIPRPWVRFPPPAPIDLGVSEELAGLGRRSVFFCEIFFR
jgi:hypothetical protein